MFEPPKAHAAHASAGTILETSRAASLLLFYFNSNWPSDDQTPALYPMEGTA